jgi:signal transduction histidine kinase
VIAYAGFEDVQLKLFALGIMLVGSIATFISASLGTSDEPRKSYLEVQSGSNEKLANIHVDERIRMLTAFSHDVQTPITRMRLRLELADYFPEQQKLLCDLQEAEQLIRVGIAYARNTHVSSEAATPTDVRSLVESLVADYQDTGRPVVLRGDVDGVLMLKPAATRRILSNFIDNALKFAGSAELLVHRTPSGRTTIAVLDRGPGIAPENLESVKEPFVRLQCDQTKGVPGTGLGLAIASQLAADMSGKLLLENREGGGLSAQIILGEREVPSIRPLRQ